MSKICQITGKKSMFGNNRSHALNKTKRKFFPNLHRKRYWSINKNRFVKLLISSKGIRVLNKLGINKFLANFKK